MKGFNCCDFKGESLYVTTGIPFYEMYHFK